MINLLILCIPAALHNSGHYWALFFGAFAVLRLFCNGQRPIFAVSIFGTAAIGLLPYVQRQLPLGIDYLSFMLAFQITIIGTSLLYNIYTRAWARDALFFWAEPVLAVCLATYFVDDTPATTLMASLYRFHAAYIVLQACAVVWVSALRRGGSRTAPTLLVSIDPAGLFEASVKHRREVFSARLKGDVYAVKRLVKGFRKKGQGFSKERF